MLIIGITGTNGAGKGTVAEILKQKYGFKHLSMRKFLEKTLGENSSREKLRELSNKFREKYGTEYIVTELFKQALQIKQSCIIESVRCVGEVEALRKIAKDDTSVHFLFIGVDANQKIRWKRSKIRGSGTDDVTFEEFKEAEEKESISENPAEQNLPKCLALTDHIIYNNGTIEDLEEQVLEFLSTQESQELRRVS